MVYPLGQHNPFSEQSDRRSQVGMKISDRWTEEPTGIMHFLKTNLLTGERWHCITDPNGNLLAEFTLGRRFNSVTLIRRRAHDGHELGREVYGLKRDRTIPTSTTCADLKKLVESGLKKGELVLVSGSGEPREGEDGNVVVETWTYVHGEDSSPLGKISAREAFSREGGLASRTQGDQETFYDPTGPIVAPLHSVDARTGKRTQTMSVDLVAARDEKLRIVDEGKPTPLWRRIISMLSGRRK